jgi:ABC-type antimicrobial peptide transport system ATPase subunit
MEFFAEIRKLGNAGEYPSSLALGSAGLQHAVRTARRGRPRSSLHGAGQSAAWPKQPEFIFCDKPTSALVQAQVLNLMRDLQDEFGLSYLLISHSLAVIRHMCDDIGVMQRGRLVEAGDVQEVLDAPQPAHTRALVAAVPDMQHAH